MSQLNPFDRFINYFIRARIAMVQTENISEQDKAVIRSKTYDFLQEQHKKLGDEAAIYNHLLICLIDSELYTVEGDRTAVTLLCGHTYCKRCITAIIQRGSRTCPECRLPINTPVDDLKDNFAIKTVLCRLIPEQKSSASASASAASASSSSL